MWWNSCENKEVVLLECQSRYSQEVMLYEMVILFNYCSVYFILFQFHSVILLCVSPYVVQHEHNESTIYSE